MLPLIITTLTITAAGLLVGTGAAIAGDGGEPHPGFAELLAAGDGPWPGPDATAEMPVVDCRDTDTIEIPVVRAAADAVVLPPPVVPSSAGRHRAPEIEPETVLGPDTVPAELATYAAWLDAGCPLPPGWADEIGSAA